MSLKKTILFDLNLLSGSSELLRNAFSAYYYNSSGTTFRNFENPEILEIEATNSDLVNLNEESFLPNLSFPVRIKANIEEIISDEDWRAYLIGATFSDKEYVGIYNTNVYADHAINEDYLPYKPSEVEGSPAGLSPSIVLTTEHFQNYSRYQSYANALESELMIPNYYELSRKLFGVKISDDYPTYKYPDIKNYLNDTFVNKATILDEKSRNIFVLEKTLGSRISGISEANTITRQTDSTYVGTEQDLSKIYSLMPFANKLEISRKLAQFNSENLFKEIINEKQYEYKFLKLLKETFQNEISLTPSTVNFGLSVDNYSIDYEAGTSTQISSSQNMPLRLVDVPTMLLHGFRNPAPETTDVNTINSSSYTTHIEPFEDTSGAYRHIASDRSLDILNSFKDIISTNFDTTSLESLGELFSKAKNSKYHETIAFRIQKIGGPPTGDSRTENTIQNIWFYNRNEAIRYIDTQVKYDTEYTYKVFSYVLLQGYKYQTTGLVATRKIAEEGDMNCLEFYDPFTGQTSPQLAAELNLKNSIDLLEQFRQEQVQLLKIDESNRTREQKRRLEIIQIQISKIEKYVNALASNAQINTEDRYLADFNITIEPSVKIVEIPLEEKTMRIVDHPPNDFNVSPYHLQDQSNRLAFYLKYDTFSVDTEPYPTTLSLTDERNATSYKEGKDFVPGSLTKEESVSAARFIEVYRTTEKPTSYQSFVNNLRTTIDLKTMTGDIASDHFFMERVRENTKYYYTFRAVNENGVAGQLSPIFESELINDGGYVYGLFNQLSEDELVEPPPKSPTLSIKNLLNVVPNIRHLQLDTSDADFTKNSVSEKSNIKLGDGSTDFWNQKFKIRLTSKKTGRKLDINLTFERK
jgi:hypothetical protein